MDDLTENNVIRFKNISQKKDGLFANFSLKTIRNGVIVNASISVDISYLELHAGDPIEKIASESAQHALKQLQKGDFTLESLDPSTTSLGVAQLG